MSGVSRKQLAFQQELTDLETTIAGIEAHRAVLGDLVADTALELLREKLATLIQPDTAPDERKRVTVLFADVSGYTALSENLDPEDVAAIMNRLFEAVTVEIHRYGGTIDKYAGDAVMALFGAPQALENHEEMAARAALAMQQVIKTFSDDLQKDRGFSLQMRIGLNTGEVLAGLVGGLKSRSYTVMGDTVNLAARLESAAPVGGILASSFTTRKLHAIFDLSEPDQISVKGKSDKITVYRILGEKSQRGRVRGVSGLYAPMIGREAELALLQETFKKLMDNAAWLATAVTGAAGLGKSRLQNEFIAWMLQHHPQTRILMSRSFHHTRTTPYHFIGELIRSLFQLSREANAATAVHHLTAGLEALEPDLSETERLYQLGSLAGVLAIQIPNNPLQNLEPEQRRDRTFLSLERIFLAAAAMQPLLIVIDDLHWADALSLEFLDRILQLIAIDQSQAGKAMWLISSRPAENLNSSLGQHLSLLQQAPHQTIHITALDTNQSESLIEKLLDQKLPEDIRQLITQQAQGNPFYVEEVLRSLIEEGALRKNGKWTVTQDVATITIPPSVQDILAARIDRLPPQDKQITQHAAIIGRIFWQHILNKITAAETVEPTLFLLEMRQLAERMEESLIVEDWEWVFHHGLIQEVAYKSVPKHVRRVIHQQVAAILESQLMEHNLFLLPLIAEHYELGQIADKAILYLGRAGEQAAALFANQEAISYYSRAITLLMDQETLDQEGLEALYRLLNGRLTVYHLIGQREPQRADLEQLQSLAERLHNDRHQAEVALRYSMYYHATSDYPNAVSAAQKAVAFAEASNDTRRKVEGLNAWASGYISQGTFDQAIQHLLLAQTLAREIADQLNESITLVRLGIVHYYQGKFEQAKDKYEDGLHLARQLNNLQRQAACLTNLMAIYHGMGDMGKALTYGEESLEIAQIMGDRSAEAAILNNLGIIHHALGSYKIAQSYNEKAAVLSKTLQDRSIESLASNNLGLIFCDLGDYETAVAYADTAVNIDKSIGDRIGQGYSLTTLGRAFRGTQKLAAARQAHNEAMAIKQELGQEAGKVDNLAELALISLSEEENDAALAFAEQISGWITEKGINGIEYPLKAYMSCMTVFEAVGQYTRAQASSAAAFDLLTSNANKISDPDIRQSYLQKVPLHQEIHRRNS
ncbi:MAG: tetratricopeptide repeat protein [Anaerolineales bacterium]|nr:tetratricopeptide repeat protein [Anaerolineales bacterium]